MEIRMHEGHRYLGQLYDSHSAKTGRTRWRPDR